MSLVTIFILKPTLSDSMTISLLLWLLFPWNIFFHPFTFILFLSRNLKCVLQTACSCILFLSLFFFNVFFKPLALIAAINPITLNVTSHTVGFTPAKSHGLSLLLFTVVFVVWLFGEFSEIILDVREDVIAFQSGLWTSRLPTSFLIFLILSLLATVPIHQLSEAWCSTFASANFLQTPPGWRGDCLLRESSESGHTNTALRAESVR